MESSKITPFMKQCFVTAAVGINIVGVGCAIGFPAILLPQLNEPESSFFVTKETESWIAAVLALTILIGNFITPAIMDRYGRKIAHCIVAVVSITSWVITVVANSAQVIIIGRIFIGVAAGLLGTIRSILIGEYTSPHNRGAFLTTISLAQAFGILFVHLVGSMLNWQKTALICAFFPFISLIMTIYSPESPSWILTKGRHDECRSIFRWLRGPGEEQELEDMINARIAFEQAAIKENKIHWFAKFKEIIPKNEFYKPIQIIVHCCAISQFSGVTPMAAYSTVIIGLLMGPDVNVHFWMVFLDAQRFILNTAAIYMVRKFKRRLMVLSTGILSVASHFAIAIYIYCRYNGWDYDAMWLPVLLINLQFLAVGMGTVPIPQIICGEVFSLEYRSIGATISLTIGGGLMFLSLKTYPELMDKTGLYGAYTVHGSIVLINLIILLLILPETKGKTLQQIEDEFRGRSLTVEELEARQSLQSNPLETNKTMSDRDRRSSSINDIVTNI